MLFLTMNDLAATAGPHCEKVDPVVVRVGDRTFAFIEEDDPSLHGKGIRKARRFRFCQERPAGAPFTADSLMLQLTPERLGVPLKPGFTNTQLWVHWRPGAADVEFFPRTSNKLAESGRNLDDLPQESGFLVFDDGYNHHYIATDESAKTLRGNPLTFWCRQENFRDEVSERCGIVYALSDDTTVRLTFSNPQMLPARRIAIYEAARQIITDAEQRASQRHAE